MAPSQPKTSNQLSALSFQPPALTRYTLCALLIFTPLARASFQGWAITTNHLLTLIALTAFLIEKSLAWNWKWIKTPLDIPIFILTTLSILSTVFSLYKYTSIWSTILLINYVVIFYLIIHTVRLRSQFRQLVYIIAGVAALLAILGLTKWSGANSLPWWSYIDNKSFGRLTFTIAHLNHPSSYMEITIFLLLGFLLTSYRNGKLFFMVCIACFFLLAIMLFLAGSGLLGLAAGLGFMPFSRLNGRYRKKKLILVMLIAGFFMLKIIGLAGTSVTERTSALEQKDEIKTNESDILSWVQTVEIIKDHALFGTGPGTYPIVFSQYQPLGYDSFFYNAHNDYLHFTSELGFPLAGVMVWFIVALYREGFRKLKNPSRFVRGITVGAISGITAILVHSFSDSNLTIHARALLFTVLVALVVAPLPLENVSRMRVDPK